MYNYFMLIGRVLEEPTIEELEDGKKTCVIKLNVRRSFCNAYGEYEADVFKITFWDFLTTYVEDYIKKGIRVAIKGRMQTAEQGIELIGERVMFF